MNLTNHEILFQKKVGPTRLMEERKAEENTPSIRLTEPNENAKLKSLNLEESAAQKAPASPDVSSSRSPPFSVPSPDSAIELSKSSEDFAVVPKNQSRLDEPDLAMLTPDSGSSTSGIVSSNCDSSDSSAIADEESVVISKNENKTVVGRRKSSIRDDENDEENALQNIAERTVDSAVCLDKDEFENPTEDGEKDGVEDKGNSEVKNETPEEETEKDVEIETIVVKHGESRVGSPAEFELYYDEPPDAMRNDNNAIDSDSDDNVSESTRPRPRRVAFSGMASMEPLSIDVDNNDMPPNVSIDDIPPNITIGSSNMPQNNLGDSSSDAILRNLLARPSTVSNDLRDGTRVGNDLEDSLDVQTEGGNLMRSYGDSRGSKNFKKNSNLQNNILDQGTGTGLGPMVGCGIGGGGEPSAPLENVGPLLGTNGRLTPTPSEASSCAGTVGSSGSGTRASATPDGRDSRKKRDSDSSFDHSEGPNDRSDVSTATCNETGETLECGTDVDERLGGLESGGERGDEDDDDGSATPQTGKESTDNLHALLNLDELGEISIKVITLVDVLDVISKSYRSVSDEEIKRYTDFMVWFANVAKSACPHGTTG